MTNHQIAPRTLDGAFYFGPEPWPSNVVRLAAPAKDGENPAPNGLDKLPKLDPEPKDSKEEAADPKSLGLILWKDANNIEGTDRLVKGVFGEESLNAIAGSTGSGKTFVGLDLGVHIAAGKPWLGRRTMQGSVLYIGAEGQRGLVKRIAAMKRHYGIDPSEDLPFALYPAPIDLVTDESGVEKVLAQIRALNAIWKNPVRLVIPDTLARCFGDGDENATRDMNLFVQRCDAIRNGGRTAVAVVHHFGKDEAKGMRGSVALKAGCDTCLEIHGTSGVRKAQLVKQKDGTIGTLFSFNLAVVNLGVDEDGDPITSCVVEPCAPPSAWEGIDDVSANAILNDIDACISLPEGEHYCLHPATLRAALHVVLEHFPDKGPAQAQEIIKAWVKNGTLVERKYHSPEQRKYVTGLFVEPTKRPGPNLSVKM